MILAIKRVTFWRQSKALKNASVLHHKHLCLKEIASNIQSLQVDIIDIVWNGTFWGIKKKIKTIFLLIKISYILEHFIRHNKKIIPEIPDKEIQYILFNCPKIKRILLSDLTVTFLCAK